jgi:hypothetical protein
VASEVYLVHERCICLDQPDESAVAEHSTEAGHQIKFHETGVPAKTSGYMDRLVDETVEIKIHPHNKNTG